MFRLIRYLKGYYFNASMGLLLKFIEALFDLAIPLVVAGIIDKGIGGNNAPYIWRMGLLLAFLAVIGFVFSLTCQYFAAKSALGFGTNLRKNMYSHINSLSCYDLDSLGIPSLITRLTSDVNNAQQSVNMFIRLATRAPFMLIGSIAMAMVINPLLSLIFVGASILVSLALYIVMTRTVPYYKKANKQLDNVSLLTRENVTGVRVVRAFSRQKEETEDFAKAADSLSKTTKIAAKIAALMTPLSFGIVNLANVLILYFGGYSVSAGSLTQGEVIALINYMTHIFYSLTIIATIAAIFAKGSASAKRINKVLDTTSSIKYGNLDISSISDYPICKNEQTNRIATDCMTNNKAIAKDEFPVENLNRKQAKDACCNPVIEFQSVSFSYGTNTSPSLEDISFSLERGQILGIIGRTGSGKSSVINLLQRFYDAEKGNIKLFGNNIADYTQPALRSLVASVPQTAVLFSGSIRENMLLGNENATDDEIWAALKIAQAESFVNKLSAKLDAQVIKGGKNFSGGQRQRLTIARALVKNSPILVLDDSASALDFSTDAKLRRAIKRTSENKAVIIISQRAPSIIHANKILVLENGRQAGLDSHKGLMLSCDIYKEIYQSQVAEG